VGPSASYDVIGSPEGARLSIDEAFDAAFLYMEAWWNGAPETKLAIVLSNSQLGAPRMTADPAAWEMWVRAVLEVLARHETPDRPSDA